MGAGSVVVAPTRVEEALDWVDLGADAWANMQPTCGPIVPVEDWADSAPSLLVSEPSGRVASALPEQLQDVVAGVFAARYSYYMLLLSGFLL